MHPTTKRQVWSRHSLHDPASREAARRTQAAPSRPTSAQPDLAAPSSPWNGDIDSPRPGLVAAMTAAAPPRATPPRPAVQVSAPSAHSASASAAASAAASASAPTQLPAEAPPAPAPPPPAPRRSNRSPPDYLSDKATAAFIRRTLCAQQSGDKSRSATAPIEELLPPLTSRNDVDLQLYALLAVILREFVQAWYSKITPDESFVAEIVQIVAHCTRALEQRLRKVDLESLLFDEIPDLLDRHITGTRSPTAAILWLPSACSPSPRRGFALGALIPFPQLAAYHEME